MRKRLDRSWSLRQANETYFVRTWGQGYFSINEKGHVAVHPRRRRDQSIDLKDLVDEIRQRGIELPLLLRFSDILRDRVAHMNQAFRSAFEEFGYRGDHLGVYPIKTNQQRYVVEEFLDIGRPLRFGLECGSKPELLAVLALTQRSDTPIICNGFKDDEYLELVLLAQKLGKVIIPVVEKPGELDRILEIGAEIGVRPELGIRVKLATPGAGRWKASGGDRSKFGLTVTQLLRGVERLRTTGHMEGFRLLHFHLGSQITNIHNIKNAITEAARVYSELRSTCPRLDHLDVGGGLGVDYDGSRSDFESSMNYSLEEYARDIVARVQTVCDEAEVPHPTIVTESGRATVAYHSVLVFNVLGTTSPRAAGHLPERLPEGLPPALDGLHEICTDLGPGSPPGTLLEAYHDAVQSYEELLNSFKLGILTLEQRSLAEGLYFRALHQILSRVKELEFVPEDLVGLEDVLSDTYFCNMSIFQSLPDSWAIDQLFPILPIHRLDEAPLCRGILADITCDSDGKIDRFINPRDSERSLPLHSFDGGEYYLGAFLVGAYQEILGDLHNLFGDTNSVHVSLEDDGELNVETVVKGDTVQQVLGYVQYSADDLLARIRKDVETGLRSGRITLAEAAEFLRSYETGLRSYTYLSAAAPRTAATGGEPRRESLPLAPELARRIAEAADAADVGPETPTATRPVEL